VSLEFLGLIVLVVVFVTAALRDVHMGVLALVASFVVGLGLVGEDLDTLLGGFPIDGLLLLLGITYLFGMARQVGALDWLVQRLTRAIDGRDIWVPWVFYLLANLFGAMGSPHTAFTLVPVAMSVAASRGINQSLMAVAMGAGAVSGGFAPTSLLGIITGTVALSSGLEFSYGMLFLCAFGFSTFIFAIAFVIFGGLRLPRGKTSFVDPSLAADLPAGGSGGAHSGPSGYAGPSGGAVAVALATTPVRTPLVPTSKATTEQKVLLIALLVTVLGFTGSTIAGIDLQLGVISLTVATIVALIYPDLGKAGLATVDWKTILLLGGIVTYIGVIERLGTIEEVGELAAAIPFPLLAGAVLCLVAALVSAFASTIGILGFLIPLAVPLVAAGGPLAGTGFIYALAVSSALVDSAPFSTTGAAIVAGATEDARPQVQRDLLRWGLSMVVVGPVITLSVLVVPELFL